MAQLHVASATADDSGIARVVSRRSRAAGCCAWSTTSPTRTSSPSARSSPMRSSTAARAGTSRRSTRPGTTCATSAWTASSMRRSPTRRSSPAPRWTPPPTSAGRAPARSRPRARRARLGLPERARWMRRAPRGPGAGRRLGGRRAALRRHRLARAPRARGGRRCRRARAGGRARSRAPRRRALALIGSGRAPTGESLAERHRAHRPSVEDGLAPGPRRDQVSQHRRLTDEPVPNPPGRNSMSLRHRRARACPRCSSACSRSRALPILPPPRRARAVVAPARGRPRPVSPTPSPSSPTQPPTRASRTRPSP